MSVLGLRWLALLCLSEGCSGGPSLSSSQEGEPRQPKDGHTVLRFNLNT
jgi:hypothetical protein